MQQRRAFDDGAAHHMALLAMEQYGVMLAGLGGGKLHPAATRTGILAALREGLVPVWMPTRMVLGRPDIAESWDVTSDSLAAWLAGRLAAGTLILVKSVAVEPGSTIQDLVGAGVVDAALPGFLARARCGFHCIPATEAAALAHAIAAGTPPGVFVSAASACVAGGKGDDNIHCRPGARSVH